MGGRQKGTPNKSTKDLRKWVASILDNSRDKFAENLNELEPAEYVRTILGLLGYAIPKQAPISAEEQLRAEYEQLERLLENASDEAVDKIAKRVIEMGNERKAREHQ